MVKLVSQWILFPLVLLIMLFGVLWAWQNPIVIILTLLTAAIIVVALRPYAVRRVKTGKLRFVRK